MSEATLAEIVALHFDPRYGSPYWLRRARTLGFDPLTRIRTVSDLVAFGPFDLAELNRHPVTDFVPAAVRAGATLVLAETGGTTGEPRATAYSEDDFQAAFVMPFLAHFPFEPRADDGQWLWIGPGGPHVIGKAAQCIARATTAGDAFSVDFDPRWYRRLAAGSLARARYLEHVLDQALRVLAVQNVRYLFSTPVVLEALAARLPEPVRARVRFLYLGGMPLAPATSATLAAAFPAALALAGYGNTLFGVCHQQAVTRPTDGHPAYFAPAPRLVAHVVPLAGDDAVRIGQQVAPGERGQVLMHRLDRSGFLPCVLERDSAVRLAAGPGDGIGDPQPLTHASLPIDTGIY